MKCMECHQGRRFAEGSIYCRIYGMIIRESHECKREGWKIHDDDDDQRSFGHHLIGAIKAILGVILTLLAVIIVLNILYITGNGSIVDKMHDRFGDTSAFKFLFFSHCSTSHTR